MMRYDYGYGMMNGFGIWGGIIMGFGLLVLILVAIYFYKQNNNTNNDALELLKMKFVKGEITEEEYVNKKSILLKK
ncbi:MAG TPA: SHOCT domain-containing protein [Paludibacter sp.]